QFIEDRRRAISRVLDQASVGDCVLIAGKGHETFQEVNSMSIPFDDRLVTAELLEAKQLVR
ncbi:MAG: UDP-N-acetylmuramoyl-L-alanyl-D-glutamate--2,6-diaminopimelate ligase, partial [Opitutae bacterium]